MYNKSNNSDPLADTSYLSSSPKSSGFKHQFILKLFEAGLLLVLSLFIVSCGTTEAVVPKKKVEADFTYTTDNLSVTFTSTAKNNRDNATLKLSWFLDNNSDDIIDNDSIVLQDNSTGFTHIFPEYGSYKIALKVQHPRYPDNDTIIKNVLVTPVIVDLNTVSIFADNIVAISPQKEVFAWGNGRSGAIGDGSNKDKKYPVKVAMPDGVIFSNIAAGKEFAVATATNGKTYGWGNNSNGQLGTSRNGGTESKPIEHNQPGVIFSELSAGDSYVLALESPLGLVYSWGNNERGQLGDPAVYQSRSTPGALSIDGQRFSKISAGKDHSMALTTTGVIYTWGSNEKAKAGLGTSTDKIDTPKKITAPPDLAGEEPIYTDIAAGYDHSLALTNNGEIYAWGSANDGQLGTGNSDGALSSPIKVQLAPKAVKIAAGNKISFAITEDGSIYAWGYNENGQVGVGSIDIEVVLPTKITSPSVNGKKFVSISAGDQQAFAVTDDNQTFTWGKNSLGLGAANGIIESITPIPTVDYWSDKYTPPAQ